MNQVKSSQQAPLAPLLVDVGEAGRMLGISKWSLYELMQSGVLPSVKIGSRRLISRTSLGQYVADLTAEAEARHGI